MAPENKSLRLPIATQKAPRNESDVQVAAGWTFRRKSRATACPREKFNFILLAKTKYLVRKSTALESNRLEFTNKYAKSDLTN